MKRPLKTILVTIGIFVSLYALAAIAWLSVAPHAISVPDKTVIYMPPAKDSRLMELESTLKVRGLFEAEMTEYLGLIEKRNIEFKKHIEPSVSEILKGVTTDRRGNLIAQLKERGLDDRDVEHFMAEVEKHKPEVLKDLE